MPELTTQEIRSRNRQAYRQEQDLPKVKWAAFQGDDDLRKVLLLHVLLVLSEAESSGLAGSDRLKVPLTKRRAGRFIPMGLDWNTSAPRFMPDETMQPEVIPAHCACCVCVNISRIIHALSPMFVCVYVQEPRRGAARVHHA